MAIAVTTVASGGLPVIDVTATTPRLGMPVTEVAKGIPVTKVTLPMGGLPVTFVTPPLLRTSVEHDSRAGGIRAGKVADKKGRAGAKEV